MLSKMKKELAEGKTFLQFGFLQTLGQIISMLIPLVIAKLFSPEAFGRYSLSEMILFLFVSFAVTSTTTSFVVFANRERADLGKINKSFTFQISLLTAGLAVFLTGAAIFRNLLINFASISLKELIFICLAVLGMVLKEFTANLFLGLNMRLKYSLSHLLYGASGLLGIIIFQLTDKISLAAVFLNYFIAGAVVFAVFFRFLDWHSLFPLKYDKKYFLEMFHFTKWLTLTAMAAYFISWSDTLVLKFYVPLEQVGIYSIAYKLFKGCTLLVYIIPNYFIPFISENVNRPEKISFYLNSKRPKLFLLGTAFILLFFFLVPYLLDIVYEDKFQEAVPIVRLLLAAALFFFYTIFYGPIFYAFNRYRFSQIAVMIQAVTVLILDFILVPKFGMYGAAAATISSFALYSLLSEIYFQLKVKKLITPPAQPDEQLQT